MVILRSTFCHTIVIIINVIATVIISRRSCRCDDIITITVTNVDSLVISYNFTVTTTLLHYLLSTSYSLL